MSVMEGTQKPFACKSSGCNMRFTNEDHLTVHTKKHAMSLHLGLDNKAASFVADQTPTPTRLIRNLDEIGLFEEIIVNPFDETFRRAVEAKSTSSTTNEVLTSGTAGGKGGGGGIGSGVGAADDDDCVLAKVQSDAETLNTPHVMPYHDVTAADCRFVASPMDTTHRTLCETVEKWRSAVAQSTSTMTVVAEKLKPRLVRKLSRPISPIIVNGCPSPVKMPKLVRLSPPTTSIALVLQRANHPIAVQARMPKLVQLTKAPTTSIDLTAETVREKLKRQIVQKQQTSDVEPVNSPVPVAASSRIGTSVSSEENNIPPPAECESPSKTCVEPDAAPTGHRFERNRAAAQRYRSKIKKGRMEMQITNDRLEEENRSLRAELQKVKALLLAHQTCSVTKAMAQGKSIPVGHPTMIINSASDNCLPRKRPIRPNVPTIMPAVPLSATMLNVSAIANVDITKTPIFYLVNQTKSQSRTS